MVDNTGFKEKVYDAVAKIPRGQVATYGQISQMAGKKGAEAARAVGNALHVNPYGPALVPCHRVVNASGQLAHSYAFGGAEAQRKRLTDEKVPFLDPDHVDLSRCGITIETHPLEPFIPIDAKVLFLGSFPPPKARWSMDFFYPNFINDFWRIQGLISFGDPTVFEIPNERKFDRESIINYCKLKHYAFYDTASEVCRLKANASDDFLEILKPTDVRALLARMPQCSTVVTTGGKASSELAGILGAEKTPAIGDSQELGLDERTLRWWRMPSSSRAYPMSLEKKAEIYRKISTLK